MRKKIIAANWKMHMTIHETESFVRTFARELGQSFDTEVVIAPPFTSLPKLSELLGQRQNIQIAAQNFYHERSGAFTGEISAPMLRELYVRYIIIGHSERRQLFGESNQLIHQKIQAACAAELRPILCIGETLEQREAGQECAVLETQLRTALEGIDLKELRDIIIAYEPIWAIGTGKTATPALAQEAHAKIREVLTAIANPETAQRMRIQYGGSVKPENAAELLRQPDIDGALVGGASLDPRSFLDIIKSANTIQTAVSP